MHGNHGSYSTKLGQIHGCFMYVAGNVYNWKYNTMCYTTLHNIPGHDEDLDAGRYPFYKEAKWHNFHRFQQYYSVFYC
jgi:linoleoyl-CoA desaturase